MLKARKERYAGKIELARERISNIQEWVSEKLELKSRLACLKAFQELAEALTDITAMICADSKKQVKDDSSNIEKLAELKIIDGKNANALKEANGLRNRIVHEYNGLSFEIFSANTARLLEGSEIFLEAVEQWLKKQ